MLTEGQAGDSPIGEQLVEIEEVKAVNADKVYDSYVIREALGEAGKEAVIPPRSNRISPAMYDKIKYKERNRIERFFNRLKQFRSAAARYDKLDVMYLGTVTVAMLVISLKQMNCEHALTRTASEAHASAVLNR